MIPIRETLFAAPAAEPVTLSQAKAHIRASEGTADDALITMLIAAARKAVEDYTARALVTQTWDFFFDGFPVSYAQAAGTQTPSAVYELVLPRGYCQSVTHVKYLDTAGVEQTLVDGTGYQVSKNGDTGARIKPLVGASWPTPKSDTYEAVRIRAVVGWPDTGAALIPAALKHAVLMLVGHYYENREAVLVGTGAVELPLGARTLMDSYALTPFA